MSSSNLNPLLTDGDVEFIRSICESLEPAPASLERDCHGMATTYQTKMAECGSDQEKINARNHAKTCPHCQKAFQSRNLIPSRKEQEVDEQSKPKSKLPMDEDAQKNHPGKTHRQNIADNWGNEPDAAPIQNCPECMIEYKSIQKAH